MFRTLAMAVVVAGLLASASIATPAATGALADYRAAMAIPGQAVTVSAAGLFGIGCTGGTLQFRFWLDGMILRDWSENLAYVDTADADVRMYTIEGRCSSNGSSAGLVNVFTLPNIAVGAATLSYDSSGGIIVEGMGSTGNDGVRIKFPTGTSGWDLHFSEIDVTAAPEGAFLDWSGQGSFQGSITTVFTGHAQHEGSISHDTMTFAPEVLATSTSLTESVSYGGTQDYQATVANGPCGGDSWGGGHTDIHCRYKFPVGIVCTFTYPRPTPPAEIALLGLGTFDVDAWSVQANLSNSTLAVGDFSEVTLRGKDIPPFTLTDETFTANSSDSDPALGGDWTPGRRYRLEVNRDPGDGVSVGVAPMSRTSEQKPGARVPAAGRPSGAEGIPGK